MPLYHTKCDGCGQVQEDFLASVDDVLRFDTQRAGPIGFICLACGSRAIIQVGVACRVKLPGDNKMPADVSGERLTPKEFAAKYGADAHPVEPGTVEATRRRDALKAYNHRKAQEAGFRDQGHMLRETSRKLAARGAR